MAKWARWAIAGAAAGGVVAALGGYLAWAYSHYKRERDIFWEECG